MTAGTRQAGNVMTIVATPVLHPLSDRPTAAAVIESVATEPVVTDTVELRWFGACRLPDEAREWFTNADPECSIERRTDTYWLRPDVYEGVKWRSGQRLERKVGRRFGDAEISLTTGLAGRPEHWRRWSPADGMVRLDHTSECVDVHKTVLRRRFLSDGSEIEHSPLAPEGDFCDVELVAVTVHTTEAWSLAFTAGGRPSEAEALMRSAGHGLPQDMPAIVPATLHVSCGYPLWLANHRSLADVT